MLEDELVGRPDVVLEEFAGAPFTREDDWFEYDFDDEPEVELVGLPDVVLEEFAGLPATRLCDFVPSELPPCALYEPFVLVATVERGP